MWEFFFVWIPNLLQYIEDTTELYMLSMFVQSNVIAGRMGPSTHRWFGHIIEYFCCFMDYISKYGVTKQNMLQLDYHS